MENYQNLFSLDNKTALITGGTGGLGSAIALLMMILVVVCMWLCAEAIRKKQPVWRIMRPRPAGSSFPCAVTSKNRLILTGCWMRLRSSSAHWTYL